MERGPRKEGHVQEFEVSLSRVPEMGILSSLQPGICDTNCCAHVVFEVQHPVFFFGNRQTIDSCNNSYYKKNDGFIDDV